MLHTVLIVAYLIVALLLIGLVLIQQGKGADMGASFGSGGSNTVFGAPGAGNFLTRSTAILATLFFVISLVLGSLASHKEKALDEWENLESPAAVSQPAEEVPADVPGVEQKQPAQDDVPQS